MPITVNLLHHGRPVRAQDETALVSPVRARMRFPMEIGLAERVFSASRQRWFVLGLCLLAVAFSIQYALKARGSDGHPNRSAIMRWWQPLRHLADENIYERYAY